MIGLSRGEQIREAGNQDAAITQTRRIDEAIVVLGKQWIVGDQLIELPVVSVDAPKHIFAGLNFGRAVEPLSGAEKGSPVGIVGRVDDGRLPGKRQHDAEKGNSGAANTGGIGVQDQQVISLDNRTSGSGSLMTRLDDLV